jgi:hypothetical protein
VATEKEKIKEIMNNFFGSKLNTVLLFILIILMVFAIRLMLQNKELYLHPFGDKQEIPAFPNPKIPEISGNTADLVSFSILPGSKVNGVLSYKGVVKGGYFFEGNILVGVTDINKKIILQSHANAKGDWMTIEPVSFEGNLDFSKLPKGEAFIEIHNDNASGLPEKDKAIYIPVVIE